MLLHIDGRVTIACDRCHVRFRPEDVPGTMSDEELALESGWQRTLDGFREARAVDKDTWARDAPGRAAGSSVRKVRPAAVPSIAGRGAQVGGAGMSTAMLRRRASSITMPTDPALLGYIAGIIDGEGCLTTSDRWTWCVQVGMTDRQAVDLLEAIGGTVREESRVGCRTLYRWRIRAQADVEVFLAALMPHLRVKREAAEGVLAHIRRTREQGWTYFGHEEDGVA